MTGLAIGGSDRDPARAGDQPALRLPLLDVNFFCWLPSLLVGPINFIGTSSLPN